MSKKIDNPDVDYSELERLVDQAKDIQEPDERTATWETIRPYPELARQLAARRGDVAKVEMGYEHRGGKKTEAWLLSIIRPIGNNIFHFTKIYPRKEFKGEVTARMFLDEAFTYFKLEEINYAKTLH